MAWIPVVLGLLGLMAGFWLRAPAMLFVTAGIVVAMVTASLMADGPWYGVIPWLLVSVTIFHATYIGGLALAARLHPRRSDRSESGGR